MSNTISPLRLAGAALATAFAVCALLLAAGSAQAEITLSETMVSNNEVVVATGTPPSAASGTTLVAAALCDIDGAASEAELGERCREDGAAPPQTITNFTNPLIGLEVEVEDTFDNWNFAENEEGEGTTECAETGDEDCAIVVSFYGPFFQFLGAEAEEVTFE